MKRFIGFVKKEFYHIFRDRRSMFILFGMPIAQIMLFGFAIICFSLGIFIAWYEYKQCNGIQPLIPDYQYRKIMEILNEDKENK